MQPTQAPVTAINILLEPDATMLRHAEASNRRLLELFPGGFSLDDAHRPHITLIQCFVSTEDLDKVCAAAGRIFAGTDVNAISLEAFGYYYVPGAGVGLAGIVARSTAELLHLQQQLIDVVAPFMRPSATIAAFSASHGNPALDSALIDYVATFVPRHTGSQFSPHVTTGVAATDDLDAMLAEPFEPFTFAPIGGAVYQIGPYGTAARQLSQWLCA